MFLDILTNDNKMLHLDLIIKESNPIGDRDAEDKIIIMDRFVKSF